MSALSTDLHATLRRLVSERIHVGVVVTTLAIGVVATTIVFSVVNAVLLAPLPYPDADRLAMMRIDIAGIEKHSGLLLAEIALLPDLDSFEEVEAVSRTYSVPLTEEPMIAVSGASVSPGLFPLLGVVPALGRTFTADDAAPGAATEVILSHRLWRDRFGADPSVVGQAIDAWGNSARVVGVMPQGFRLDAGRGGGALTTVDAWFPLFIDPDDATFFGYRTLVRLAPGSLEQARAEAAAFATARQAEHPDVYGDKVPTLYVEPLQADLTSDVRAQLWALFATVGVVLLLSCTSAAGLIVARARRRVAELALCSALGASPSRILRQMGLQSVAVGLLVCIVSVPASIWGMSLFLDLEPGNLPRAADVGIDARVLFFGIVMALAASLMSGFLPAWQASRVDAAEALKTGARSVGRIRRGTRGALVVLQLAFCFALLVSAGLLMRTFLNLSLVEPGFRHDGVLTAQIGIDWQTFNDRAARWEAFRQLTERVRDLPGVEAAGAVTHVPLGPRGLMASYSTTGIPENLGWSDEAADFRFVVPGYFESLGRPMVAGRPISAEDNEQLRRVVVIDSRLAESAYPGEDPVGRTMHIGIDGIDPAIADPDRNDWTEVEIVGVVQSARITDLRDHGRAQIYLPYRYRGEIPVFLTVRTGGDPASVVDGIRDAMTAIGFNRPMENVRMLSDYVDDHRTTERFLITLLGSLSAVAVLISALGIFGVVATMANERRTEHGVRRALGARAGELVLLNLREGVVLALAGIGIGLLAAPALGGGFRSVLYGVPAFDPISYLAAALALTAVAVLAALIPALGAGRASPSEALRTG